LQSHGQPLKQERGFSAVHSDIGDAIITVVIILIITNVAL